MVAEVGPGRTSSGAKVRPAVGLEGGVSVLGVGVVMVPSVSPGGWVVPTKGVGAGERETLSSGLLDGVGVGSALVGIPTSSKTAAKSRPPALSVAHAPVVDPATRILEFVALCTEARKTSSLDDPFCGSRI